MLAGKSVEEEEEEGKNRLMVLDERWEWENILNLLQCF